MSASVLVQAHAKLTLSLRVIGRRHDGFHDVEGLVASLADLADDVEVSLRDGSKVTVAVEGEAEGVPPDEANLAAKAVGSLLSRVRPGAGADVRLDKRIPAGAGLGGGSADAAGALHATVALVAPDGDGVDLTGLGAELGSDVPFCVTGGLARVAGRGEMVEPLPFVGGWWAVVVVPGFSVATGDVYDAWDVQAGEEARRVAAPTVLGRVVDELVNELEPAAIAVEPRLDAFRDRFESSAGRPPLLAGSGSAYFVLFDDPEEADDAARRARSGLGARVAVASGAGATGVTRPAG